MRWQNDKIGFDDRVAFLLGILLMPAFIPFLFLGVGFRTPPYFNLPCYIIALVVTTLIWLGARRIMIWARTKYAAFPQIKKRLWVQSGVMIVYALVVNNFLGCLLDYILKHYFHQVTIPMSMLDITVGSNVAALFCILCAVAIYESVYFICELRKSVEEKELLKRERLNAQLSALKNQVNPHFLFNNLNTLSALIPEDPGLAVDFVQQMAKVYRHILEVKDEESILLHEELDVLKAYTFLLQTRFGKNLDICIDVDRDTLSQRIVPLSLQILMENAIKHNIVSSEKPLRIHLFTSEGKLVISNTLQKKNQKLVSTGIGLDNIRNRYKLLGDREVAVEEGPGSFTVSIPLIPH